MIQTPYSDRLQSLRQRLQKHPGREGLRDRYQNLRQKNRDFKANQPAPVPYSGAYDSTMAGLNQNLANTQLNLAGQGLALEQQYGFGGDQSNPFSVARQLERQYAQQRNQTTNSYAASGQLYAGSLSNAASSDRYNFEQSMDAAQREYLSQQAALASQGVEAQGEYNQAALEAYALKLQEALNQPPDPTEAGGGRPGKRGRGHDERRRREEEERRKHRSRGSRRD